MAKQFCCVAECFTQVFGDYTCQHHTPKNGEIGVGTTTLDWLYHQYPWLKEYVDSLKARVVEEEEAHCKTAKQFVDIETYAKFLEKKFGVKHE
jgi:hypothetical protein